MNIINLYFIRLLFSTCLISFVLNCDTGFDVALLIDVSDAICEGVIADGSCENYRRILGGIHDFLDSFDLGGSGQATRVSVVWVGTSATVGWLLNRFTNRVPLLLAIHNRKYIVGEKTSMIEALRLLRTVIFTPANGDRVSNKNIAILVTASNPNPFDAVAFQTEVNYLSAADIAVYVYAISTNVNMDLMKQVSSFPRQEGQNWFQSNSENYNYNIDKMYFNICGQYMPYVSIHAKYLTYFNSYNKKLTFSDIETYQDLLITFADSNLNNNTVSTDVDNNLRMLYFIGSNQKAIYQLNLFTGTHSKIYTGLYFANLRDLKFDSSRNLIYVADSQSFMSSIFRITTSGDDKGIIIREFERSPWSLQIHSSQNELFWTDCSPSYPGIYKIKLETGSSKIPIVTVNILKPTSLALDIKSGYIYWGDSELHQIKSCKMDGSQIQTLYSTSLSTFNQFVINDDFLYMGESVDGLLFLNLTNNDITRYAINTEQPLGMTFILPLNTKKKKVPTATLR